MKEQKQKTKRLPQYRRWAPRDLGYVFVDGKRIYFPGAFGSQESRTAYANFLTAFRAGVDVAKPSVAPLTVAGLCARFLEFAKTYYRKHGRATGSFDRFAGYVVPPLLEMFHSRPANSMTRADIRAFQTALVERGLARKTINDRVGCAKHIFKWGVDYDLIEPETYARVGSLRPLEAGRSAARETEPIQPVDDFDIKITAANASQVVADMIFVLRYSAMRPGEIFQLRWRDVDRSGPVWVYRPAEYKTEHAKRKRPRIVPLTGGVRAVLQRYRHKKDEEPIFSPGDAARERAPNSTRKYAATYNKDSFRTAIKRAAERAGVAPWSPNRLRHSAATEIRRLAGLDAAQVILGHASSKTTEIYAETDVAAAVAAAERVWGNVRADE